ncbi:MAG: hypothetical protein ACKVU1_07240 [bacterium]
MTQAGYRHVSSSRTSVQRLRRLIVAAIVSIAALFLLSRGCGALLLAGAAPNEVVLQHRLMCLEQLMQLPADGSLVAFERALVIVDERLVRNLLLTAIPYQGTVGGFVRIALGSADVSFDDGTALVRLDGSAWLGDDEANAAFARISVYGELDVVDLDPEVSVLRTRLRIIAVDATDVSAPMFSRLAERFIENLGWLKIESFDGLNYDLEIPVRLGNELRLPEIDTGDVRIAATTIPLRVAVQRVRALHNKLWVAADVVVCGEGDSVATPSPPSRDRSEIRKDRRHRSGRARRAAGDPKRDHDAVEGKRGRSAASLSERYAALHAELESRVSADAPLAVALADTGEIALALREGLLTDLLREIARRYLDRVELNIDTKDLCATKDGELKVKTPFGQMAAGRWSVRLDFHGLRGVLRARRPEVTVIAENRVQVAAPVSIESGSSEATLHFKWDPKGMANLVCREFETSEPIEGRILRREYIVRGEFVLAAGPDGIVADPEFPEDRFPIAVDPSTESWSRVMAALESQDRWNRCGIAMDPENVARKLAELAEEGFKVKLPRSIFRPVVFPASLVKSVKVGRSPVKLSIRPNALRVSPGTFWYSASFDTDIDGGHPRRWTQTTNEKTRPLTPTPTPRAKRVSPPRAPMLCRLAWPDRPSRSERLSDDRHPLRHGIRPDLQLVEVHTPRNGLSGRIPAVP